MKKLILCFVFVTFFICSSLVASRVAYATTCQGVGSCMAVCVAPFPVDGGPDCHQGIRCCLPAGSILPPVSSGGNGAINFDVIYREVPGFRFAGNTISFIVSDLLPYVFVLAGILLLFFLISGGFEMMMSAGNPKSSASAKGKITYALIGFIIIFVAYWVTQLIQVMLGINVNVI